MNNMPIAEALKITVEKYRKSRLIAPLHACAIRNQDPGDPGKGHEGANVQMQ